MRCVTGRQRLSMCVSEALCGSACVVVLWGPCPNVPSEFVWGCAWVIVLM